MPPNTVSVTRPGRWGNPFKPAPAIREETVSAPAVTADNCVRLHTKWLHRILEPGRPNRELVGISLQEDLRGRNLACWCHLCPRHADGKPLGTACKDCDPCHADTLLEIANRPLLCEAANG